jgi:hypothetical protein
LPKNKPEILNGTSNVNENFLSWIKIVTTISVLYFT